MAHVLLHLRYSLKLCCIIIASTLIALYFDYIGVGKESIIMIFLVGVLIVTVITNGYLYGIMASVFSVLIFNFYFTLPIHTLTTYDSNDIILMASFLVASLISGNMTKLFQKQLILAKNNEQTAKQLYKITESFLNITGQENILKNGIDNIKKITNYTCHVRLFHIDSSLEHHDETTKTFTENSTILRLPIQGIKKQLGELLVESPSNAMRLENELIIMTVVTQMGLALDRELMYNDRQNIRVAMEREEIRTNLLRAISHDLRTPLTGIVGASSILLEKDTYLDEENRHKLQKDIHEEALWLNSLVENILNMTRIENGHLLIEKNDEVVDDVIYEALSHIKKLSKDKHITVSIPDEVESVPMDGKLIVQVLINLLENAIKHTPEHAEVFLKVYKQEKQVYFEISDSGPGIDPAINDSLFSSFVTYSSSIIDGKKGIGLGLSICKSIIDAHHGEIYVNRAPEGGAKFVFTLPLEATYGELI